MIAPEQTNLDRASPGGPLAVLGEAVFFWLCLAYLLGKAAFFALRIRGLVFPDESSWFGMAEVFSRAVLLPVDSPDSYPLGLVTHTPSLYFFLMGKALALNPFPCRDLLFLRMINVGLAGLTVAFAWRLARQVGAPFAVRALFLVMLTNTIMFTFVAGSVNYDNLSTLLAVVSLYYLLRFLKTYGLLHALAFLAATLAGMLTKNELLPYGAALLLVFFVYGGRRLAGRASSGAVRRRPALGWREGILGLAALAALAANLILYGGNLLRYRVLIPGMEQVLPLADCLQNRLFVRDYAVRQFAGGKLSLLDSQRLVLGIRDPGDRADAWDRLGQAETDKLMGPQQGRMGRWRYARKWSAVIVARTYSVAAHLSLFKDEQDFYPYYAVFILAGLLWLGRGGALALPGMGVMAFAVIFYTVILMQVVNYGIYLGSGLSGLAMTGRYMFPVLAPLYLLVAHGLLGRMPRWWQVAVGLAVGGWFVAGEFPWFLSHAGPEWYL